MKKISLSLIIAVLLFNGCTCPQEKAKYIFYFIGDGMGLAQTILAENYLDVKASDTATIHLELNEMPVAGFSTTYSANNLVTCSSAAGTALSTGRKTNNGMLGVNPDTIPLTSIAQILHEQGYKVGIISSVSIDHATPGAFYAHSVSRNEYLDIAKTIPETGYDYFGGGGLLAAYEDSTIYQYISENGYLVSNDKSVIDNHKLEDGKLYAYSKLLCDAGDIPYYIDEPKYEMRLPYFLKKAISLFSKPEDKFFIMIEGGKIDWSCHGNDAATTLFEVIDFNDAYKVAYEFYLKNPKETLIVMTADHETGGLSIGQKSTHYNNFPALLEYQKVSESRFNEIIDEISGNKPSLDNIYKLIEENFGFNNHEKKLRLNHDDSARIELVYQMKFKHDKISSDKIEKYDIRKRETLASIAVKIMSEKSGTGWTTNDHSGIAVPVRAIGAGAEKFAGFYDNTDIPKYILQIAQ
ncbi:MAG: alkaline phosphatase [Bacteroidales bacterium]|jgi:alkaline phosphatase|nr:alkaline phosphatase [Bacteroidales bacterium]